MPPGGKFHGYTLVELMVVVALASIMAGGFANVANNNTRSQSTAGFARAITFAMMRARGDSLTDRCQRRLLCTSTGCAVQRTRETGMTVEKPTWIDDGERIPIGPDVVLQAVNPATEIGETAPAGPLVIPAAITFFPDGSATPATVFVTDVNRARRFKVYVFAATGMARMVDRW